MSEERTLDIENNSLGQIGILDICTSTACGVFALGMIWLASSLLIYMVR